MISAIIIAKGASKAAAFLPLLFLTIHYFQRNAIDTGSTVIDQPGDLILSHYDFIIVGAGSAGKNNNIYLLTS